MERSGCSIRFHSLHSHPRYRALLHKMNEVSDNSDCFQGSDRVYNSAICISIWGTPGGESFGFDNNKSLFPSRPMSQQENLKQPVPNFMSRAWMFSIKHTQLLSKGENFETRFTARTEKGTEKLEKAQKMWDHGHAFISYSIRFYADAKRLVFNNYGELATHRHLLVYRLLLFHRTQWKC